MAASRQAPLKNPRSIFVGGEWVRPSTDALIDVISPATEDLYLQVAGGQVADVDRAVAAARDAFDNGPWPRMSHRDRAVYLNAIAGELERRAPDVATIWPNEMGIIHSMAQSRSRNALYSASTKVPKDFTCPPVSPSA